MCQALYSLLIPSTLQPLKQPQQVTIVLLSFTDEGTKTHKSELMYLEALCLKITQAISSKAWPRIVGSNARLSAFCASL